MDLRGNIKMVYILRSLIKIFIMLLTTPFIPMDHKENICIVLNVHVSVFDGLVNSQKN